MDSTNMIGQFAGMRVVERFNPGRMVQVGLVLSVVVFTIYGVANHYLEIIPVQLLLAISYSALFIGVLNYLLRRHRERGTVAGLMNSCMSLAGSVGPFLGGAVSQAWGYGAVMYAASGITLLGFLVSRGIGPAKEPKASVSVPEKV